MAELMGAVVSVVLLVVVFLPILTFLRLARLSRDMEDLAARLSKLESASARARLPVPPGAPVAHHPPAAPAEPGAPVAPVAPSAPVSPPPLPPDLEERIGGRGLLYVGVLVLLLGVSFFLKYAFDNAWINETARIALGALVGVSLVMGGLRSTRQGLDIFGQALIGAGFAILYLVVYAALNFYAMIDSGTAFALMIGITVAAAVLADRQRAQALAFIAAGGGFLTPALVGADENAQLTLFSYVAILILGTMLLAFRHQWPALNVLSYVGTFVAVVAWAGRFYTEDQWLRTLLFLTLFCVAFLIILRETRRSSAVSARAVSGLLSTAPVFYHLAAIIITAAHAPAIHIYLIAFSAVGLWLTVDPHRAALRLAILLGAFVPMFGTVTLPDGPSWLLPNLVTITSVALLHVMGLADRVIRQEQRLGTADLLTLHVTGLGLFALLYESLQPVFPDLRGGLAVFVALGAGAVWRLLRSRDELASLHAAGLAFTLIAIGIGVEFDGATAIIGWAAEAMAAVWLGVRSRQRVFEYGGLALWLLAAIRLFDAFGVTPAAFTVLVNARTFATIFVIATGYVMAWRLASSAAPEAARLRIALHIVASVLSLRWMTAEIQSFWEVRYDSPQAYLYEQMLLSLAWGLYGAVVIVVGLWRKYAPLRYIGMVVIAAASLKVFFYDLWELGGIYRVIGFLGFGVLLVLVSYLYQHRRVRASHDLPPASAAQEARGQVANDAGPGPGE